MLLTYRLVRLIEQHSDHLATSLLHKVQQCERNEAYCHVPADELKQRVHEIYLHLGEWLLTKSEADIEGRYTQIGTRRAQQGVPLSQLIWAIILTKETLWEFITAESTPDRVVELFGKQELLQLLDQFFDHAVHAAAVGYEWAEQTSSKTENTARKTG